MRHPIVKGVLAVVAALLLLIAIVVGVGLSLPAEHVVTRSAVLPHHPQAVWAAIRDFGRAAEWQPDVQEMERVHGESSETWRMRGSFGEVPIRVEDEVVGSELVTRIADEDLPFGGTWFYQLEPVENGTRLTITERGVVRNPAYRFLSRYVLGHEATVEGYLDALEERLAAGT